jgi:F-type H+-transporting ATPase subunit b
MQIDWFTFGAQIVNFLLLVWLLKRFLYGPIVNAMAEREQHIADRFAEAQEKEETAETKAHQYHQKLEALAEAREDKIAEAEEAAREKRREMIEEARTEVDQLEAQWKEALRRERETFLKDLADRVSRETITIARRALRDLAHADLEQQVVRVFLDRLTSLDDDRRRTLTDAVQSDKEISVHTAFELDETDRQRLTETLQTVTEHEVTPEFSRDAEIGFGIEVRAGGHKIAWSLQSYFAEMSDRIRTRIDDELSAGASSFAEAPSQVLEDVPSTSAPADDARPQ